MSRASPRPMGSITWDHEYSWGADVPSYRVGRSGLDIVAEWNGAGILRSSADGKSHSFFDLPGANDTYRDRVRNVIAPGLVRHLRGEITLHASGVAREGLGVAFVGPSGAGKSTLAAALCDADGVAMVADDVLFVDVVDGAPRVVPTERAFRLSTKVDRPLDKSLREPARFSTAQTKLIALVQLEADEAPTVPSLTLAQDAAAFKIVNDAFTRFVGDDPRLNARDFETVSALVSSVPVFVLRRSLRRLTLPMTVELLLEMLTRAGRAR